MKTPLNIDEANKIIKNEIQVYEKLTKVFTKILEAEEKASKIRVDCFQNFQDMVKIVEKDNEALNDLYKNFGKTMKGFEEEECNNHLKTLKDIIIPVTQIYPFKLKENKVNLDEMLKAKKNTENLKKSNASQIQINKSINNEKEKASTFQRAFKAYEKERIGDNKRIFLKFIHSELKYHCAIIQQLSELFKKTNEKNTIIELKKFAKGYNIENYNFNNIGINMKKFENDIIKEEDEEKEKRSEVYSEPKNDKIKSEEQSENSDDNNEEDSFKDKKNKSRKTKNSQIGKSLASDLDNKGKSRNIEDE